LIQSSLTTAENAAPAPLKPYVSATRSYIVPPLSSIERRANAVPALVSLQKATRLPPIAFVALLSFLALAFLRRVYQLNAKFVSNLIAVAYPAYASIKAIERPDENDDERWLTYWPIFGLFVIADHSSERIRKYFPLYFSAKIAALYWLAHRDGSLAVYRRALRPLLVKYSGLAAPVAPAAK
jgi:hypothetical protein